MLFIPTPKTADIGSRKVNVIDRSVPDHQVTEQREHSEVALTDIARWLNERDTADDTVSKWKHLALVIDRLSFIVAMTSTIILIALQGKSVEHS